MKTYKNLYPHIYTWENLEKAYRKARKGKRGTLLVADFEYNWEKELLRLQEELAAHTYRPGPYHSFFIHEPKKRLISAAPFRDRVVHHALCAVIEPIFEARFIHDSYANRVGKGTHRALDRCTQFARRYRYVLPCDIKQHFPSIDHAILRNILAKYIACPQTMGLIEQILASGVGVLSDEYEMVYFPGDDLLAATRPRGLPIGNLTSQFWSNCYLNPFDHFVKRELKCQAYLRYVDDFLLFANDKLTLQRWRAAVIDYLAGLRLTLHQDRAQPRPVGEGLPFLGFVVYPAYRRVKGRKVVAYRRRLKQVWQAYQQAEIGQAEVVASLRGWLAHIGHGDSWALAEQTLRPIIF
ncbi:MAG: reverse transcriptase/maturase family protein [Anaerolineae bacterium]|nr:reverse transcriptase/maturase family protein [Anaerolineae bacterium]